VLGERGGDGSGLGEVVEAIGRALEYAEIAQGAPNKTLVKCCELLKDLSCGKETQKGEDT